MRKIVVAIVGLCLAGALAGCTHTATASDTLPPENPTHRIAGSVLPQRVAGYTALGGSGATPAPTPGQTTVTYAADNQPLNLAVVTFDPTGKFGAVSLSNQQWYGTSRCGVLWKGDAGQTPRPTQSACVTVLTDGVMTTVAGGSQTPSDLAQLANAIYDQLA